MTYEQELIIDKAKKLQEVCESFMCEDCPFYGTMGCNLDFSAPAEWDLDRMVEAWERENRY